MQPYSRKPIPHWLLRRRKYLMPRAAANEERYRSESTRVESVSRRWNLVMKSDEIGHQLTGRIGP